MTEACNRLAPNYAFLAVYSHTIIINVCECCVNYIKMLMPLTSITAITILTMFVYCIISDHTDGTVVQRATNNVDACTQCAYLFLVLLFENNDVIGPPNKILPRAPRVLSAALTIDMHVSNLHGLKTTNEVRVLQYFIKI